MSIRNRTRGDTRKKEWLLRYSELLEEIEREDQEARYWREKSQTPRAPSLENMGIRSANTMSMPDLVLKYMEMENACLKLVDEAKLAKDEIKTAIEKIDNQDYRRILNMHYLDGISLKEIADKLHYSINWIWVLHRNALKTLEIS